MHTMYKKKCTNEQKKKNQLIIYERLFIFKHKIYK